jgi:hypothetical protein
MNGDEDAEYRNFQKEMPAFFHLLLIEMLVGFALSSLKIYLR